MKDDAGTAAAMYAAEYHKGLKTIAALRARIAELESAGKWIGVEEQVPPETGHPGDTISELVRIRGVARYHYPTKTWCWIHLDNNWQPLPPGPKEK